MNILHSISDYYRDVADSQDIVEAKLRRYKVFEISGIAATAILKWIMMDWLKLNAFYIVGVCSFWIGYIVYRSYNNRKILTRWGFKTRYFLKTLVFMIPFFVLSIATSFMLGYASSSVDILNWRVLPVLFMYPLWGVFQQYIMLVLIAQNLIQLDSISLKRYQVILITSLLFSLVHFPSYFLMIFTFFMEVIFLLAWFKWRNLLALGLTHGIIATFLLFYVMERDLWLELFTWIP
jgi:hypothetical protein